MAQKQHNIFVIGAGVVGLTTAIQILKDHPEYKVSVFAEFWPTDEKTIKYTSSWAGAHHVSISDDERQKEWDKKTYEIFGDMMAKDPSVPLIKIPQTDSFGVEVSAASSWGPGFIKTFVTDWRELSKEELPEGCQYGNTFKTFHIDTPNYLLYLLNIFHSLGGQAYRATLASLSSLLSLGPSITPLLPTTSLPSFPPSVIINCSGLGALTLGEVKDTAMYPTRGQTVLIRAPWIKEARTVYVPESLTYVIVRKSGNVILGGTQGDNDWDPLPREDISNSIMERCLKIFPEILEESKRGGGVEALKEQVIEYGCGLRTSRKGGIRLEIGDKLGDVHVIHNYGHGGGGYQASWGCALEVVKLLDTI